MSDKKYPDGKYVVIKREKWFEFVEGMVNPNKEVSFSDYLIDDAVVIRRQDVFAGSALDAYANSIKVARDVLMTAGATKEEVAHLTEVIDYFQSEADLAFHSKNKMPD